MELHKFELRGKRVIAKVLPWAKTRGGIYLGDRARRNEDYVRIVKIGDKCDLDIKLGDVCLANRLPHPHPHPDFNVDFDEQEYRLYYNLADIYARLDGFVVG